MVKPLKISEDESVELAPPRFLSGAPMLFVGLSERHAFGAPENIPAQWRTFMAAYENIPDKIPSAPAGVSADLDDDGNFDYLCAAEVARFSKTPKGLIELRVPVAGFTFGLLSAADVERLHASGSYVVGTATHVADGIAWRDAGADALGAQGAVIGTACLTSRESAIPEVWKTRVRGMSDTSTTVTRAITGRQQPAGKALR